VAPAVAAAVAAAAARDGVARRVPRAPSTTVTQQPAAQVRTAY